MKYLAAAALVTITTLPAYADALARFLNVARPVVVVADTATDPNLGRQITALNARTQALVDYEIAVVSVTARDAALREKLGLPPNGFAVALVGKDGSVKKTWTAPVDPARIFALIDRMPMRREETRGRGSR